MDSSACTVSLRSHLVLCVCLSLLPAPVLPNLLPRVLLLGPAVLLTHSSGTVPASLGTDGLW